MFPFTCGEKKTWKSTKMSQNIMSMIVEDVKHNSALY